MKLRNISTQNNTAGFTLIELLIVVAIIMFMGVIGVVVGVDTYSRYIFRSDLDKVVVLLQKARSSAINNVNENSYGVYFGDASNLVMFRGMDYDPSDTFNYKVGRNKTATSTNTCTGSQVVFSQLTGNATDCEIVIIDGNKITTTTINNQGGINY